MKITDNDIRILETVARYYALSAAMLHRFCFPSRKDNRHTRRRLSELARAGYVRKSAINVAFSSGNSGPAYTPTELGSEILATYYSDDAWLQTYVNPPRIDRLWHWIDVSWTHHIVHQACEQQPSVKLVQWVNEWQPATDENGNPSGFALHSQFCESPPLSCSPDAAFLLEIAGHRKVYYVEVDRGTSGAKRVASSKMPGFNELFLTARHKQHFPSATVDDFCVLLVTVDVNHRNRIKREVAKRTDLRPELWMFASRDEFTPEQMLFGDIYIDHTGEVGPLVSGSHQATDAGLDDVG